jgi:hypothetical protein
MKTKIASIAVTAIVLAACAALASAQTPVSTKVMVNTQNADRPLIWIDQEPIIVRSPKVKIVWLIASEGYEFPDDGIVFPKAPKGEFVCAVEEKDRRIFACVDSNSKPARHKYTIKVRPTKGAKLPPPEPPAPLDPWVVNDR